MRKTHTFREYFYLFEQEEKQKENKTSKIPVMYFDMLHKNQYNITVPVQTTENISTLRGNCILKANFKHRL